MKAEAILMIARMAYVSILRSLLVKAISDPNEEWDDVVLEILDGVFLYGKTPTGNPFEKS